MLVAGCWLLVAGVVCWGLVGWDLGPRAAALSQRRSLNPFAETMDTASPTGEELVHQAKDGSHEALELPIRRHQPWVYNIVLRIYHPQDAEDVTQENPIKLLTKLPTFERRNPRVEYEARASRGRRLDIHRVRSRSGQRGRHRLIFRRLDNRFHVRQIFLEGAAAGGREAVFGVRQASLERLLDGDVLRVLQLARVDAEVPVGRAQLMLEIVERQAIVDGKRADDAEPQPLVNQPIELERAPLLRRNF